MLSSEALPLQRGETEEANVDTHKGVLSKSRKKRRKIRKEKEKE